ncbi:4349_t:CDS:2, partial [Gigaspora margarita]
TKITPVKASKNDNKSRQEVQKDKTTPVKASRNDNTKSDEKQHLKAPKDKKAAMKSYQCKASNDDKIISVKASK